MKNSHGISLFEQLLVLAVIGMIIVLGVKRYHLYEQQQEVTRIKTDLGTVFAALDVYFHQEGCTVDGKFIGNFKPRLDKDLQILNLTNQGYYLKNYSAEIQQFSNQTPQTKPLYQFVIVANTNNLSAAQLRLIANETGSFTTDYQQQIMQWHSLPDSEYQQFNGEGVLASRLKHYRQQLIIAGGKIEASCAQ